jgi:hypothetical protein
MAWRTIWMNSFISKPMGCDRLAGTARKYKIGKIQSIGLSIWG